jgi:protein SCO1
MRPTWLRRRGRVVAAAAVLAAVLTACGGSAQDDSAASRPHPPATLGGVVMSDPVPASIALLEITVDPQRDTPARLAAYQKMFGSPQPAWTLATATTAAATAALWKFFHVYYHRQPTDDPDATDWLTGQKLTYDVEHSNTLIFLSADGKQRYIVDAAADTGDNRPPPALIRFMTPQGRHNLYHPSPGGSWTVPQAMQVLSWLAGRTIAPGGS